MDGVIALVIIGVWILVSWLFYMWGASIAEGKGRSRSNGWWAVFLGLIGILIIALMSDESAPKQYIPHTSTPSVSVSDQLEKLASLRESGALTEEEFESQKRQLLKQA